MTYVGPYSQATLMFEPNEELNNLSVEVATPGTLLDYISRTAPHFLTIIRKANMLNFYNDSSINNYTVFVPRLRQSLMFDANTSRRICRNSTVPGIITADMLMSSPHLILYTLMNDGGCSNQITVSSDKQSILLNNNQNVLYGDIKCSNGIVHVIDRLLL